MGGFRIQGDSVFLTYPYVLKQMLRKMMGKSLSYVESLKVVGSLGFLCSKLPCSNNCGPWELYMAGRLGEEPMVCCLFCVFLRRGLWGGGGLDLGRSWGFLWLVCLFFPCNHNDLLIFGFWLKK